MKQVYRARDGVEAHFIRAQLEARGIDAIVQGDSLQWGTGDIPFFHTTPTVHTRDEDAEDALAAIAELRAAPAGPDRPDPWTCPTCGESIEPQFTECWRCGADADTPASPA